MSEPVRFRAIEIEGFRGFRDRVRLDLDASAVILQGSNGSGKTSFCDALQWLLLGNLSRFDRIVTRRDVGYVANLYRQGEAAYVRADIAFEGIGDVILERTGAESPGHLEWTDTEGRSHGEEAEAKLRSAFGVPSRADFATYLLRAAILQQDMIRSVLEDKPGDRYKNLVALLGLDEVQDFQDAVSDRSARAAKAGEAARDALRSAEARFSSAQQRMLAVVARLESRPDARAAQATLQTRLDSLRHFASDVIVASVRMAPAEDESAATAQRLGAVLRQLLERRTSLELNRQALMPDPERELGATVDIRDQASAQVAAAESALADLVESGRRLGAQSENLTELASLALPLLSELCPVCGQPIDVQGVRERLERGSREALDALDAAKTAIDRARTRLSDAQQLLSNAVHREQQLVQVVRQARQFDDDIREWTTEITAFERQLQGELGLLRSSSIREPEVLAEVVQELREIWSAVAEYSSKVPSLVQDSQLVVSRSEADRLDEAVVLARDQAQQASLIEEEAATLLRSTVRACAAVTARRSNLVAPIVQDIFGRLDPHPMLKNLDFLLDVYYEKGAARPIVRDIDGNVEANPLLVLSSSQTNVAALACFLALGWATGTASAGFALLDDPLQSLDDVNALGFADVCRHLRTERQLIISTHDRRLSSLLRRKLAPRVPGQRTLVLDFQSWGPAGPMIESSQVDEETRIGERRVLDAGTAAA